jgi:hypothetical protein
LPASSASTQSRCEPYCAYTTSCRGTSSTRNTGFTRKARGRFGVTQTCKRSRGIRATEPTPPAAWRALWRARTPAWRGSAPSFRVTPLPTRWAAAGKQPLATLWGRLRRPGSGAGVAQAPGRPVDRGRRLAKRWARSPPGSPILSGLLALRRMEERNSSTRSSEAYWLPG